MFITLLVIGIIRIMRQNKQKSQEALQELEQLYFQLEFLQGNEYDKTYSAIEEIFEDVILLLQVKPNPDRSDQSITKIFDTSLYLKNHIIGLTYFVQEQIAKEQIASQHLLDMAQQTGENAIDLLAAAITIQPGCTVLKMKNGDWLWRQEEQI